MGTTDANGIYFYEDTDPVSPLHTLLNTGQTSVSNFLGNKVFIRVAATQSARDALAVTFPPTAANPLYVHRSDTRRLERNAGDGWSVVNPLTAGGRVTGSGAVTNVNGITSVTHGLGYEPSRISCIAMGVEYGTITEDVARLASPMVWLVTNTVIQFRWRRIDSGAWFGNQGPIVHTWSAQ